MPRVAKLSPKKLPNGKWELNIPPSLSDSGSRRRLWFDTMRLATAEADKLLRERRDWGVRAKHAEPHLVTEATAAHQLLKPYGISLLVAVRQWVAHKKQLDASETVQDALLKYEALKEGEGRSSIYLSSLRSLRKNLPEPFLTRMVADLEPADVEVALDAVSSGTTKWNLKRREIRAVFEESVRRGMANANPAARVLSKRKARSQRIDLLTVEEAKSLLATCTGSIPLPKGRGSGKKPLELSDALPAVAVALFAGLRPEELRKVDWSQIDLKEKVIRLDGVDTKTRRRRHVDLSDNLVEWLKPHARSEGSLVPSYWKEKWTALRAKVGISERVDVCRHTFGSAWWAIHRDINQLSFQMGNSPEVCRTHYVEHMSRSEAMNYWTLAPQGVKIKMVTAA